MIREMLTIGAASAVALSILCTYLAPTFATLVLPQASEMARTVLQLSVWALPLQAMSIGMSYSLQAGGSHDEAARIGIRATIASILVSVIAVAYGGVVGAALSFVARPAILFALLVPAFALRYPNLLRAVPAGRLIAAALLFAVVCAFGSGRALMPTVIYGVCGLGIYCAALFASRVFTAPAFLRVSDISRT